MPQVVMRNQNVILALAALALLLGCSGAIGRRTASGDGGQGSPTVDGGPAPTSPDSAPPTTSPQPDSGAAAGCPNGNLLSACPGLPVLCRPFPAAQPGPLQQEPSTCQSTPRVTLSDQANKLTSTGMVKDWILAMGGDDTISGMECNDRIHGNMGADWIHGNMGDDELRGGAGGDTIHAGAGNDVIYGGGDDDTLIGGLGDDKFFFAEGEGHDTVEDGGGRDTIVCAANGTRPRARLLGWSRVSNDLLLSMSGNGSIRIKQYFASAARSVDAIVNCQ